DVATALLEDNLRSDRDYWLSALALGMLYHRHGDDARAGGYLTWALALNPDLAGAHELLARMRMEQGRWPEAEAHVRRLIALQPQSAAYHHALGVILRRSGDLEGALSAFREELRLDPDSKARREMEQTEEELKAKSKRG